MFAAIGSPNLQLTLDLSSPSPILSTVAPVLTSILDPVIRVALVAAAGVVQREVGLQLQGLPSSFAWGRGGPPLPPVPNPPALEPLTLDYLARVRRDLLPFGMVYSAMYDDPTPGQGAIVGYHDHGDSPIWTGHYLAAEAYRYDLTGDPTALAGATRVLEGFATCLQVTPHPGLLARAAIPLHSPHAAALQGGSDPFVGLYQGVSYQGIGNISRDQYIGLFLGLGQTMLRLPTLRRKAGALAAMAVDYLEANDWVAYRVSQPSELTVLFQTGPRTMTVTVLPLPPEKRGPSNFFWQRSPFEPDSRVTSRREYAGTELALPYWAARSHGILR